MGIEPVGGNFFDIIVGNIREFTKYGKAVESLNDGFKKIVGQQVMYYWHEDTAGDIDMAIELSVLPQALMVNAIGKKSSGSEIYATDMYDVILRDNYKSLRLMSDTKLTGHGFSVWKRLLNLGHTISVYDKNSPTNIISISNVDEMENFYRLHSRDYLRYQYVLSETNVKLAETRSFFNTRRMRELSGLGTED